MRRFFLLTILVLPLVVRAQATPSGGPDSGPLAATEVLSYAEEMPSFAGGQPALHHYLMAKLVYPPEALKRNLSGTVVVQFVVDEQGRVGGVEVARTSDPVFDIEAKRIMYTMPWWTPGREQGHPVKVRCTLPIIFTCKHAS